VRPRALIVGAGVGGLTAAIALAKKGLEVALFERAEALQEIGAGLQATPNATRVLADLGVLEAVKSRALAPRAIRIIRGRDGAEISRLALNATARRGAPYLVLHRADLQRALIEYAAREEAITLTLGAEVGGFKEDVRGVTLGLRRGAIRLAETGDFLIGADGLRSIVRERLGLGARSETRFSGRVAFRAAVEASAAPASAFEPDICLELGSRAHLVHYPLRGGALINVVAVIESNWRAAPEDDPWDGEADLAALAAAFARWSKEVRRLIEAARHWRAWPLHDRPALATMAVGRIALVGDAAHPMLPFLAQGAAQAIEDAGALAECLAAASEIPAAFAAYSQKRVERAARIQQAAAEQARLYHMAGPLALMRDIGMRALGPERLLKRYDWIYGG
jgi:salicylate hydroxylase